MISNPVPWPGNARCAVAVTFDMDADSILHLERSDGFRRVSATSMLRYGPEVAVPRILQTYRELDIRQTFFVPAWCIETYPKTVDLILEDGHEIAHHGYIHENPVEQSRDEQAYWLQRGIEVIEKHTGERPRGWRAPLYNFSSESAQLLIEHGFAYDASLMGDDVPYLIRSGGDELVELPSHWGLDDWPPYVHSMDLDYVMPVTPPEQAIRGFRNEFDAAWEHGGLWIPVWHPFVSGRLARWVEVVKLLEYIRDKGNVWFARMDEIAQHVRNSVADGLYRPRVDELPFYEQPVQPKMPK